jgi:three-Cys-motif partner protein
MTGKVRKIPTSKWLENKYDRILKMTEIVSGQYQGQITEPDYGFWSLKKEIALMYWIWPFLQIASQYFKAYYYIDLFAGSGLMKADSELFVGSPIVAISSTLPDKKFSQYLCFEIDESRKNALEHRATIAAKHFETCCPKVFNADCNKELEQVLNEFCPSVNSCYLAFIDPQGISDLKWNTIYRLLVHCKGDIILNFPTAGIIRNLDIDKSRQTLTDFFGDDQWIEINRTSDDLIQYYMNRIAYAGDYRRSVDNLPVTDELNHRLYDLIFATGSKGMNNALADLKSRLERIKTRDFREIHRVLAGPQTQLTGFQ